MTPLDLARAFLEKAHEDEALLRDNVGNPAVTDAIFGFHAQQAAEKYIKGVLAIEELKPERTHDLQLLLGHIATAGYEVPERFEELGRWGDFAVAFRYPLAETPSIDRRAALDLVADVRHWAEDLIEQAAS